MSVQVADRELFAERYELRELLVRSKLGPARRAYDRDLEVEVALLIVDETQAPDAIELLRQQVREARRVTHHNVARTYDMGEHGGSHYVTMEYIDGQRLSEWLAAGRGRGLVLDTVAQLAEGLAAAHAVEVVHGNLMPASVLVEDDGRAVLGNFGLGRFESAETIVALEAHAEDTFRSVLYLAPEQVRGAEQTSAVDVYALGLLLYELWVGAPRYTGDNPMLVASARLSDPLDDLRTGASADARLPVELAAVLLRCLDPDPGARPSAASLAQQLRELMLGLELGLTTAGAEPGPAASLRRCDSLAVLPFRFRGPRDEDDLAEALVEELVDLLSATQGLCVYGTGATARYAGVNDRDPKRVGAELGVDVLVDGTVMLAGDRLRISARLIEVSEGFQLWHERFEGGLGDVFELQDKLAKRIAEALRIELEIVAHRGKIDPEAVEAYLRARQAHLRWRLFGDDGALAHYRAALAREPAFKPALAHLALATVLAWFQPRSAQGGQDYEALARQAVDAALTHAPELPESRLAAASMAAHAGEFGDAGSHLAEAVLRAPTFALAHELLGRLLIEGGYGPRGVEQLELAAELDPVLSYVHADVARSFALRGDMDGFHAKVAPLLERIEHHYPSAGMLFVRVGMWTRQPALIEQGVAWLAEAGDSMKHMRMFGELLLAGEVPRERIDEHFMSSREGAANPRLACLVAQFGADLYGRYGYDALALDLIERAAGEGLFDIVWLEHAPTLAAVRGDPRYAAVRETVRARISAFTTGFGLH